MGVVLPWHSQDWAQFDKGVDPRTIAASWRLTRFAGPQGHGHRLPLDNLSSLNDKTQHDIACSTEHQVQATFGSFSNETEGWLGRAATSSPILAGLLPHRLTEKTKRVLGSSQALVFTVFTMKLRDSKTELSILEDLSPPFRSKYPRGRDGARSSLPYNIEMDGTRSRRDGPACQPRFGNGPWFPTPPHTVLSMVDFAHHGRLASWVDEQVPMHEASVSERRLRVAAVSESPDLSEGFSSRLLGGEVARQETDTGCSL